MDDGDLNRFGWYLEDGDGWEFPGGSVAGLHDSIAGGMSLIPGQDTRFHIPHGMAKNNYKINSKMGRDEREEKG